MMKLIAVLLACLLAPTLGGYAGPTNQAGLNLIKNYHGFSPNFELAPTRVTYIGDGHECHRWNCSVPLNGKFEVPLTPASAEALLKEDLASPGLYEDCVAKHVTYPSLNANQYSALVSFTSNQECDTLQSSLLLQKLNRGDVAGAAEEFSNYYIDDGRFAPGLVDMRAGEKELFCTGGVCNHN